MLFHALLTLKMASVAEKWESGAEWGIGTKIKRNQNLGQILKSVSRAILAGPAMEAIWPVT